MEGVTKKCFVCGQSFQNDKLVINLTVNLPVCQQCKDTEEEKKALDEHLDSLADGLICGCI